VTKLDRAQHVTEWERLHGVGASPVVRRWLALLHPLAARLQLSPDAVTWLGILLAGGAVVAAPWAAAVAAAFVLLSALADALDGAVAVVQGKVTEAGARLDRWADRCADARFLAALLLAGAPWVPVLVALLASQALEGARTRTGPVTLTVGERPQRVLAVLLGLGAVPLLGAWLSAGLGVVALLQYVSKVSFRPAR
jgi:phosphatidylglycerophosphate synthase